MYLNKVDQKHISAKENIVHMLLDSFINQDRRDFGYLSIDIQHFIAHTLEHRNYYTGSFAEGLHNFDDHDYMLEEPFFIVYDSDSECIKTYKSFHFNPGKNSAEFNRDINFTMETLKGMVMIENDKCMPGFSHLVLVKEPLYYPSPLEDIYTVCEGVKYLDAYKFIKTRLGSQLTRLEKHGPAIRFSGGPKDDDVLCLRCADDLKCTEQFRRLVPNLSKEEIVFHFVATSHPKSQNPHIEFRWSFSIIESNLIRKFGLKEFQLYFLCKEVVKTKFVKKRGDKKGLCSYFVKTIIFFMREKYAKEFETQSVNSLFELFLCELESSLTQKLLPNYFVRESNMYCGLSDELIKENIDVIHKIKKDIFLTILNCKIFLEHEGPMMLLSVYKAAKSNKNKSEEEKLLQKIIKEKQFLQGARKHLVIDYIFRGQLTINDVVNVESYNNIWISFQDMLSECTSPTQSVTTFYLSVYAGLEKLFEEKHYKVETIESFRFYYGRYLALYLMSIAPKDFLGPNEKYHSLIKKLIKETNTIPTLLPYDISSGHLTNALYQYLCKNKMQALLLLMKCLEFNSMRISFFLTARSPDYDRSILSNDKFLHKYLKTISDFGDIYIGSDILRMYLLLRITKQKRFLEEIKCYEEKKIMIGNEPLFISQVKQLENLFHD